MGRRKIPMEMVKDSSTRQVTFSKRRNGVFKKADELSTLCGVDVAVMVFSPGGRPYSYGNPSVHAVVDRYLGPVDRSSETHNRSVCKNANATSRRAKRTTAAKARVENSLACLHSFEEELEVEKLRGEALEKNLKKTCENNNIKDVKDLNMDELKETKKKLEALREMINGRAVEMEASSTLMMLSRCKTPTKSEGSKKGNKKRRI
ncbi:PREDICTED: agamous-like MADS-box protein AGL29 [Tarenaya hassleriana]|uniref:agamous-like MADS-box protein AGL29 n=1 Tax=Tarenaya hassleriana TaxID=28532 RepID=UPI00053C26DA|nr:PREDICTED: agamous-like MADS-box protein AGL29 [Tarenaya hassleriana]